VIDRVAAGEAETFAAFSPSSPLINWICRLRGGASSIPGRLVRNLDSGDIAQELIRFPKLFGARDAGNGESS